MHKALTINRSCVCLPWRNGTDLVEGQLLGQSKGSGVRHLTVCLTKDVGKHRVKKITHSSAKTYSSRFRSDHDIKPRQS